MLLGPETVVVASSDFTHHGGAYGFQPFAMDERLPGRLRTLVRVTAGRLAALDPTGFRQQVEVSEDTVCGLRPLQVLADLLTHTFDGAGEVLEVTTSGEVSDSWTQSVSYASVAFTGHWIPWREDPPAPPLGHLTAAESEALVALARATLESHLRHDGSLATWHAAHPKTGNLVAPAGAFVTLHRRGEAPGSPKRLRACMGRLGSGQPLHEAVVASAVSAAHDPRFPVLVERELGELELEVSALSAPEPVDSWRLIEPGRHGVILSKGSRSAVFLPQVATEQGWDRDTMLEHLARKAGLPADAWREGARFEVFTAQVVGEGDE
jgi:AmmeMemoRadiSam system protein A